MIIVGRPINGITINGREYLLNDDGKFMRFEDEAAARAFLHKHAYTNQMIDDLLIEFIEEE